MRHVTFFLCFPLIMFVLLATPAIVWSDNLAADVGAGMLVISKSDNLWGRGKSTIASLADRPRSQTVIMAVPALFLSYRQDSLKLTYFIGATEEDYGRLVLGVKHELTKGSIDAVLFYSFMGSEWADPYALNRRSTTVQNFGLRAGWEKIAGSPFSAHYTVSVKLLNDDLSGELQPGLKRDGTKHRLGINYGIKLSESLVMTPSLSFEREVAEGAANRYSAPGGALSLVWSKRNITWVNRVSGLYALHDTANPVFGKILEVPEYSAASMVSWKNPFDIKNIRLSAGIVYAQTLSNIPFFERQSNYIFLLGSYSF